MAAYCQPGLWCDSLHVTCGLTACTPGSAPGPTLGNEYGKTLPFIVLYGCNNVRWSRPLPQCVLCVTTHALRRPRVRSRWSLCCAHEWFLLLRPLFFYFLSVLTRGVESIILTVLPRRLIDVTRSSSVPTSLAVALTARRLISSQFEDVDSGGPIGPNEQWGRDPHRRKSYPS